MRADVDLHPIAAQLVRPLRLIGKPIRAWRGHAASFHAACTDLTLDAWRPADFPGVLAGQAASELIAQRLRSPSPTMICRLGTVETAAMAAATTPLTPGNAWRLASGHPLVRDIGIHGGTLHALSNNAGFFPHTPAAGRGFVERMLADLREVDVLGTWCKQEVCFADQLAPAARVRFRDLEPYMHAQPWSWWLAGKRVLVVHPFTDTIASQYAKRERLFDDPHVLPEFELLLVRAVQSIAGNRTDFATWFDALAHMEAQITKLDFDVALIGCGAYGLPLAAHVKRLGRKAVHLGGQTQLLFGIKGKRWETGHEQIRSLFNSHWVYPSETERPAGLARVEGGAYW